MKTKLIFGFVYALILVTQLPHVWQAYSDIERDGFSFVAMGAAFGFELSIAVFTFRLVTTSTNVWTRVGVGFFIALSVVANMAYYGTFNGKVEEITPYLFSFALPAALVLYAHEFGAIVRKDERKAARIAAKLAAQQDETEPQEAAIEPQEPQPAQAGAITAQGITRDEFVALLSATPGATVAGLARQNGVNERTAQYWAAHRNGEKNEHGL